jgi:hypothetical protein
MRYVQAPSISASTLPALVMPPRLMLDPDECSEGQAEIGHQLSRIGESSKVADLRHDGDRNTTTSATPRIAWRKISFVNYLGSRRSSAEVPCTLHQLRHARYHLPAAKTYPRQ